MSTTQHQTETDPRQVDFIKEQDEEEGSSSVWLAKIKLADGSESLIDVPSKRAMIAEIEAKGLFVQIVWVVQGRRKQFTETKTIKFA